MALPHEVPQAVGFVHETAIRAIDDQLRSIDSLDSAAGILLAVGGVLAGLVFREGSTVPKAPSLVAFLASIALLLSLLPSLVAFANRKYHSDLAPAAVTSMVPRARSPGLPVGYGNQRSFRTATEEV